MKELTAHLGNHFLVFTRCKFREIIKSKFQNFLYLEHHKKTELEIRVGKSSKIVYCRESNLAILSSPVTKNNVYI